MEAFSPGKKTVNIDVSSSSQNVQISAARGKQQVVVFNDGSATAWIAFGSDNTVAATLASGMPIASKLAGVVTVGDGAEMWVAAIAAGATGKIYSTGLPSAS
jgi:hypothetical protein